MYIPGNFAVPRIGFFAYVQRFHTPIYTLYQGISKKELGYVREHQTQGVDLIATRTMMAQCVANALAQMNLDARASFMGAAPMPLTDMVDATQSDFDRIMAECGSIVQSQENDGQPSSDT